jgi:hypothetical protein
MDSLNKKLIHISVPLLIIHSLEEFYFSLTSVDPFTSFVSKYFGLTNDVTYFLGQLVLFIFLAVLLVLILLHKNINYGGFIIGVILIFEFTHVYPAIISGSYYPGFASGFILFVIGVGYWYKLMKIKFL